MKKREPISKIMTPNVLTLNTLSTLNDAEQLFAENNIHHIPVVAGDYVIGMISKSDVLRVSYYDHYSAENKQVNQSLFEILPIEQVMTKNVTSVDESTPIKDVAEILIRETFHALPVVKKEKLVGIVTTTDLIKYLVDLY